MRVPLYGLLLASVVMLSASCTDPAVRTTAPSAVPLAATQSVDWSCGQTRTSAAACPTIAPMSDRAGASAITAAPANLRWSATGTTVVLEWDASLDGVSSFVIEAGSAPALADLARLNTAGAATSLTVTNVPAGAYYVRVRAVGADGVAGPRSNEVVVRVGDGGSAPQLPPSSALSCKPATLTVGLGEIARVSATGGTGSYVWAAPGGTTSSGTGPTFATSYPVAFTTTITVTSGDEVAGCVVTVPQPAAPPPTPAPTFPTLACTPPTQTTNVNQAAALSATGGTGSYTWSAPGASTVTGTGSAFSTSYATAGSKTVTVTSGTQTATCGVVVPPPLVCAPPTQTVQIGQLASVSATGGTGTYSWSAPGSSTPTGSGAAFGTSYPAAGSYTVTLTSSTQTATCQVTVPPPAINSCVGVTATIGTPLTPPTGSVSVTVPAGQQSNIQLQSLDVRAGILTTFNYTLGPGTTVLTVPIACSPKLTAMCGASVLDAVQGANQCP